MRTTIDIPEDLLRRAKAEAALRGTTLKDYVTEALRAYLGGQGGRDAGEDRSGLRADQLSLGEGCVFPLIRGRGGPALRDLTPERAQAILDQEDAEHALESARSR